MVWKPHPPTGFPHNRVSSHRAFRSRNVVMVEGFLPLKITINKVSKCPSRKFQIYRVSKFQMSKESKNKHFMFLIGIDPICNIFKNWFGGSSGLVGSLRFQAFSISHSYEIQLINTLCNYSSVVGEYFIHWFVDQCNSLFRQWSIN